MIMKRKTAHTADRVLLCLLLVALLLPMLAVPASGEDAVVALNASGSRNGTLSVDPIENTDGFSSVLYNINNGLPTSDANAIAQTSDGFIWIGGYAGLIRYDGANFERIDPGTGIANVRCLYVDSSDRLWIGTNDSGVFVMSGGFLRRWDRADGLRSVSIRAIAEDRSGLIYITSVAGGIATVRDGEILTLLDDERIIDQSVPVLRLGSDGLIYGTTQEGDLFTLLDGNVHSFLGHNSCRVRGIHTILPDPEHPGRLFIGTDSTTVVCGTLDSNFSDLKVTDISPLSSVNCLEYINGKIWVCAGNGIGRIDGSGCSLLKNVPMGNSVEHVMTDFSGNLWFASSHQGVMKVVPNMFADLFARYGLPVTVVNSTCMLGSRLFIGTDTGLIVMDGDERVESIPLTMAMTASGKDLGFTDLLEMLDGVRIRNIYRDSQGNLWIPAWRKYGVIRYGDGMAVAFTREEGLWSDSVRTVTECADGSMLIPNSGGLSVIKGNRVKTGYGYEDGIVNGEILTVIEGFNGEYILGSDGDGIYVITVEGVRHIGTEDGLKSDIILRVKKSRFHDVYWVIAGNSLAYMTPDFRVTTVSFPYTNNFDLFEDSKGDLWILCSGGVYVLPGEDMLNGGDTDPVFFGIQSGLPYVATANSSSALTEDGDLFISGSEGVIKVNIEQPYDQKNIYKISVPYIEADGERFYADLSGTFNLPANARKITVYPYILNYSLTDPQISYKLSGFDSEYTTTDRSRLNPVDYTNLKIGSYHFLLTVRDPVSRMEQTALFNIVKGKEMSSGTMGTLVMNSASLLLMTGLFIFTSLYRKRGRPDDRLFLGLILTNLMMTLGESLSYLLEYLSHPIVRLLMIAGNTAFYIAMVFFPYLLLMYFESRLDPDSGKLRRKKLLYGIPCFLFVIVMLINLKTAWIFSIGENNSFISGKFDEMLFLPVIPVWIYLAVSLIRLIRIDKRLLAVLFVLLASMGAAEISFGGISSTSFFYTLILVCLHLSEMNRPLNEEVAL